MRVIVDTQLLLWSGEKPELLSQAARQILTAETTELSYSFASLWEMAIKTSLGRADFHAHPIVVQEALRGQGYRELPIQVDHMVAVMNLPLLHRDPFDRMLVAQAAVEQLTLLSADRQLSRYADHASILIV